MKVLTIFTGGTIGSHLSEEGVISPCGESRHLLMDLYQRNYDAAGEKAVEFEEVEPYTILSENLQAEHIRKLLATVAEAQKKTDLEGIIITHGTDTLQYAGAILQYVFGDSELPILLVSSDFVLTDKRANGLANFVAAVEFIKGGYGKGVFVSYQNPGEGVIIHRANRLQNAVSFSANVSSILDGWYGRFEKDGYHANPDYRVEKNNSASMFPIGKDCVKLSEEGSEILRIVPYPGMTYPDLEKAGPVKAILHESYHSGTICISEKLRRFSEQAKERKIPIFLAGLTDYEAEYETVQLYRELGITALVNRATIAQYCKLWLAISNNKEVISAMGLSVSEDLA